MSQQTVHANIMMDYFKNLLLTEAMADVTLVCDGPNLKVHKIVLSAYSSFFESIMIENPNTHPFVVLKNMKYTELKVIMEFMYHGEINAAKHQIPALLKTADELSIKGFADMIKRKYQPISEDESSDRLVSITGSPPLKRGRFIRKQTIDNQTKQPDSPEIEELSGDMDANTSSVPMQSHSTNSFHKSSQQEQPVESFAPEEIFGVEPSKLLEQTLTTDDLPTNMELQRRPRSSTNHSTSLVPTSMPSDALVVANQQPESPPDSVVNLCPSLLRGGMNPKDLTPDSTALFKVVFKELNEIKSDEKIIKRNQNIILKNLEDLLKLHKLYPTIKSDHDNCDDEDFLDIKSRFPLSTMDQINFVDEQLRDENIYKQLVTMLSEIGGKTSYRGIKLMLRKLLSNEVAMQYSLQGSKGKKPFKELNIYNSIRDTVRKNKYWQKCTDVQIEVVISNWLRNAKARKANESSRKSM